MGDFIRSVRRALQAAVGPGFSVAELIGQGGFGVVYAAGDMRLGRSVAIKALRRELFDSDAMQQRFEVEARVVASLRHPHIVPIFHVGEGDGIAYMVMPRIDGVTLRTELDRLGRLPVPDGMRALVSARRGDVQDSTARALLRAE